MDEAIEALDEDDVMEKGIARLDNLVSRAV